jgi:hypothetical protein
MSDLNLLLASLAVRQRGLVTGDGLAAAGVSRQQRDRSVASGLLVPLFDGLYRHAAVPVTTEMRWLAAVLAAGDGAYLSHRAAGALHGYDGIRRVRPEVTAPYSRLPLLDGVTVHRTRKVDPLDRTLRQGIPVATPARTLLDLCAVLPFEVAQQAAHDAVIRKLLDPADACAVLERSGGRGKKGSRMLREILAGGMPDDTIQSRLELLLAGIVDVARVERPVRQHRLVCVDGRVVVLDNAWPDLLLAIEADGLRWHGTDAQVRRTRARSRSIQASGWLHLVYGWSDCRETPDDTRREIEAVVVARRHHVAGTSRTVSA